MRNSSGALPLVAVFGVATLLVTGQPSGLVLLVSALGVLAWLVTEVAPGPRSRPPLRRGVDGSLTVEDLQAEIDKTGWPAWSDRGRLRVVDDTEDPGADDDSRLTLHEVTSGPHRGARVLAMVDTSPGPDGERRQIGKVVPPTTQTAVGALEWMFGLAPGQYDPQRST